MFPYSKSYEDQDVLKKRFAFYKNIENYSNNTIRVDYDKDKGLYCVAKDYLDYGSLSMKIPREFSICPYYLFPFKYEIMDAMNRIEGFNSTIGTDQLFSVYLLTYYIMYLKRAPKKQIEEYIRDNNFTEYYNLTKVDLSILDSFPTKTLNLGSMTSEHYELLKNLNYYSEREKEQEMVFRSVLIILRSNIHYPYIATFASDDELFKWAFGIVMSRTMTLKLNEYYILENYKISDPNIPPSIMKNIHANSFMGKTIGVPCVISYIDLCNHYHPKSIFSNDKVPITLETEPGYFLSHASAQWSPGDEVKYTYINEGNNVALLYNYGFFIKNNIFNNEKITIEDEYNMSIEQFNLCKEIGCFDPRIKMISHIPKIRQELINLQSLNERLLNYGRVRYLKGKFDTKNIIKKLAIDKKISHLNEITALLYYYKILKDNLESKKYVFENIIKDSQLVKSVLNTIEKKFDEIDDAENYWTRVKIIENIMMMDIYFKKIIPKHAHIILNRIINENNNDIMKLKAKYIQNLTK